MTEFIEVLNKYWVLFFGVASLFFSIGGLYTTMGSNTRAIKKLFELYEKCETAEKAKDRDTRVWDEVNKNHISNGKRIEELSLSMSNYFTTVIGMMKK